MMLPVGRVASLLACWTCWTCLAAAAGVTNAPEIIRSLAYLNYFDTSRPSTVLDVGAYRGDWTKHLQASGAMPNAFYILLDANRDLLPDMTGVGNAHGIALLGAEDGKEVTFYKSVYSELGMLNSVYMDESIYFQHGGGASFTSEQHATVTLDSFLSIPATGPDGRADEGATSALSGMKCSVLKIHTQGSELDILRGSRRLIASSQPLIIVEASIFPQNRGAPSFIELHLFMETQLNYVLIDLAALDYFTNPTEEGLAGLGIRINRRRGGGDDDEGEEGEGGYSWMDSEQYFTRDMNKLDAIWMPRSMYTFNSVRWANRGYNCTEEERSPGVENSPRDGGGIGEEL